jgi:hypothetical protein
MGRSKRTSASLERAGLRLQSITSIGATLDLGTDVSVAAFETRIAQAQALLDEYNRLIATLDEKSSALRKAERQIADYSERMLAAVAVKFGKDSTEYAQAGGVRKSDIKRSRRNPTTKARGPSPAP